MATSDKVAFITGANKGIGLETARGLGAPGITVVLGSRDLANGEKAAKASRPMASRMSNPSRST